MCRRASASAFVLLWVVGGLFACTEAGGLPDEARVRNWLLVEELRIGSLDDADQSLTHIRPFGVAVGPDEQVFIAQPQTGEIRKYDAEGGFVRTIGRRGRGPGEFDNLAYIGILGDTLYAINRSPGRLSLFLLSGEHLSTIDLAFAPPTQYHTPTPPYRLFPDGTGVVSPAALSEAYARGELEETDYLRVDRSGRHIQTLFSHSERAQLAIALGGSGVLSMGHPMPEAPILTFSPDGSRWAVVERKAARSDGASFRITELTLDGDTIHSTGISYRPVPISPGVADSIHESVAALATRVLGAEGERVVRGALQLPESYPPVTGAVYSQDQSLWIRRELSTGAVDHWEVYVEGERVAGVAVRRSVAVHVIQEHALWGVEMDELGVPYVVRYRIVRQTN